MIETWRIVESDLNKHATTFYETMFEMGPSIRELFVARGARPNLAQTPDLTPALTNSSQTRHHRGCVGDWSEAGATRAHPSSTPHPRFADRRARILRNDWLAHLATSTYMPDWSL